MLLGYVGRIKTCRNLKDLKEKTYRAFLAWADFGSWYASENWNDVVYLHVPQQSHPLFPLREPLHGRAKRDPKAKMLYLQSFLRKGVSLGHVGRN